jgi:hypothetical protein
MLIEVLLVGDVELVDDDRHLRPLIQQTVEDVLLKTAGEIENIDHIEVEHRKVLVLLEDLTHHLFLVVSGKTLSHIILLRQLIMKLKRITAVAVDLLPLFLASLDSLLGLLILVNLLLQTQKDLHVVKIVQLSCTVVEDLHLQLAFHILHDLQSLGITGIDPCTVGRFDQFYIRTHGTG